MQIVTATDSDAWALGELIATSFSHLDYSRWLTDNEDDWAKIGPRYFEREVRDAIAQGFVYTVPDLSAVVVVADHTVEPEPAPDRETWLRGITGPYFERFVRVEAVSVAAHPRIPHYFGAEIAVRPTERNKGVASLLLNHLHRVIDDLGCAVYGEASSERVEQLFGRHGYTPLGSPIILDGRKLLQPLWREARRLG